MVECYFARFIKLVNFREASLQNLLTEALKFWRQPLLVLPYQFSCTYGKQLLTDIFAKHITLREAQSMPYIQTPSFTVFSFCVKIVRCILIIVVCLQLITMDGKRTSSLSKASCQSSLEVRNIRYFLFRKRIHKIVSSFWIYMCKTYSTVNVFNTSKQVQWTLNYKGSLSNGMTGTAELLWKWWGWQVTQSGAAKNTFFLVTLYKFQKIGRAIALPAPPPPRFLNWQYLSCQHLQEPQKWGGRGGKGIHDDHGDDDARKHENVH